MASDSRDSTIIHAACVALGRHGVVILGAAGAGKSALALELMARGAVLVADDRTELSLRDGRLMARCPPEIRGKIEARGVGILAAETIAAADVCLAVDLAVEETERLPPFRQVTLLGQEVPLLHTAVNAHFPAAILQYLKGGRIQ